MNSNTLIQSAADELWQASTSGALCAPVRTKIGTDDLALAYQVQAVNTQRKLNAGESVIGAKVGLTSKAVQTQLGVDQPDFGILTTNMKVGERESIPWNELHQPKAEAEIAFVLGKDLDREALTVEGLKEAIDHAVASIEVVGSRIKNWDIRITDTIADNASASHFVLGAKRVAIEALDLEECTMTMHRRGELVSSGQGKACLGNPLNAALWLAQTLNDLGQSLKKGDVILAGALGPMVVAEPGDVFTAEIEGLGSVSVSFGHDNSNEKA